MLALLTALVVGLLWVCNRVFAVPPHLRHLPRVPILPLILSYASAETEERRTLRLLLPCAQTHKSGLVLVWAFGLWFVHCVDPKTGKAMMENRHFDKQPPPEGMLFWRFIGSSNMIVTTSNANWRARSKPVRNALARSVGTCIPQFVALSQKLVGILSSANRGVRNAGDEGADGVYRVCWSDFAHRFSLDAIGTTALGYDFNALEHPHSTFVTQYHRVMHDIANPLYVFLPILETIFPRRRVVRDIDELVDAFLGILRVKEMNPGDDIISYMLEDPEMTTQERRDNMVTLFMAGHDTTAGSLSALIYCLAKYPNCQHRAREEVFRALGNNTDLNTENLARLPYLQACIREGMRFHNPSTTTMPRVAPVPVDVCGHTIPPNTPILLNMYGVHRNPRVWRDPETFDPEQFLRSNKSAPSKVLREAITEEEKKEKKEEAESELDELENGWLPFGLGPRSCPARAFSLIEQQTLLAILLREFEWSLPENSVHSDHLHVAFSVFALNLPHDLDIIFRKMSKKCN